MGVHGLVGKKLGMTTFYGGNKTAVAVTVIQAMPNVVTQIKTLESDGYNAVQLGYNESKNINKPTEGHLPEGDKLRVNKFIEVACDDDESSNPGVGDSIDTTIFEEGQMVKVSGRSKGRGFSGGVRRYNFKGGPKTHGQSDRHRAPGSVGAGTSPGRTLPGTKMAGRYGGKQYTIKGLKLMRVLSEENLLLLKGSVPGARNSFVVIHKQS